MPTATIRKGLKLPASQPQDCCWGVPFVAMCACFLLCMPESSAGYLYVLFMDKYQINRGMASWPENISTVCQSFGGFLVMLLLNTMSIYAVVLVSAIVSCVGLVCAAFAPNITWMSATFGGVYGMGIGASLVSFTVFTMLYFDKYRATATAIKFVGWATSGVVGPLVISALAKNYDLGGTLLLNASIALHAIPLIMLLKSPRPVRLNCTQWKSTSQARGYEGGPPNEQKSYRQGGAPEVTSSTHKEMVWSTAQADLSKEQQAAFTSATNVVDPVSEGWDRREVSTSSPSGLCASESATVCVRPPDTPRDSKEFCRHNTFLTSGQHPQKNCIEQPTWRSHVSRQLTLFRDPVFYILLIVYTLCDCSLSMHTTTTVDYGRDKGATMEEATLVITYNALGQFLGRTLLPFASDHLDNGRCKFAIVCFAGAAVWYAVLSTLKSFAAFAAINVALGLSEGFVTCIRGVLINDCLGVERLPAFYGFQGVVLLPFSLSGPTIIGYFRDSLGSYDNFYRMLAAVNLCVAALLLIILWRDSTRLKKFKLPKLNDMSTEIPVSA